MPESRKIDHETFEINRAASDQESMWDGFKFGVPGAYATYFQRLLSRLQPVTGRSPHLRPGLDQQRK